MRSFTSLLVLALMQTCFGQSIHSRSLMARSNHLKEPECDELVNMTGHHVYNSVHLQNPKKNFTTPFKEYENNTNCLYAFLVPKGEKLIVYIHNFEVAKECEGKDVLILTVNGTEKERWCKKMGRKEIGFDKRDGDYNVTLHFITDANFSAGGFRIFLYLEGEKVPSTPRPPIPTSGHQPNPNCGRNPQSSRIVGGQETEKNGRPFMVAISTLQEKGKRKHWCGGALIDPKWILSASHCFTSILFNRTKNKPIITVGDHDVLKEDGETVVEADKFLLHPKYDPKANDYDIALISLKKPVTLSKKIQTICLPTEGSRDWTGQNLTAVGWGNTKGPEDKDNTTKVLRSAYVFGVSRENCRMTYGRNIITDNMFCAGRDNTDACQGDSGSPLVSYDEKGRPTVAGIVSMGFDCAVKTHPGIYADTAKGYDWIRKTAFKCGPNRRDE